LVLLPREKNKYAKEVWYLVEQNFKDARWKYISFIENAYGSSCYHKDKCPCKWRKGRSCSVFVLCCCYFSEKTLTFGLWLLFHVNWLDQAIILW
jgi:hypothetical protein